jgi:ascorbate-specific PTS system EIIC-type component UlaA
MNKNKLSAAVAVVLVTMFGLVGVASATPSITDQVTTLATNGFSTSVPILIAVATAAVGLAAALFGVRKVLGAIKSGGRV